MAVVLAVCAAAALALWAPAAWTRDTIVDRDGFLRIAEPLGSNAAFQKDVSDAAVDGVLDQVKVPRAVKALVEPALQDQAQNLTQSDAFGTIWSDSMGDLHSTLMNPRGGQVSADLNPYVDDLIDPVGRKIGVTIRVPDTDLLTLPIVTIPASPWPGRVTAFAGTASWIGWAGLAAAVVSILLARRRGIVAAILGVLVLAGGAALLFATQGVGALVPDSVDHARILGTLVQAFEKRLGMDMMVPSFELMAGGALVLVIGLVATGVRSARRRAA